MRVAVAGATGALGKEILAVLDRASWRPDEVLAAASRHTSISHVNYGDERIAVDDVADLDLDLDALFLAVPPEVARVLGEQAVDEGVAVIDCSGTFAKDADVPILVPWIRPEAMLELPLRRVVSLPGAPALLVASILGPLVRAGISGPCHATVLAPASLLGRNGVEELSQQVIALFNASAPPRSVFESGLAFDLIPQLGEPDEDGWTQIERRAVREARELLPDTISLTLTVIAVPVFSGISAEIQVATQAPTGLVARVLADGGVVVPDETGTRKLPRPRRVEGKPFAHVARIRSSESGVHLWASMDNLCGAATAAVACCRALTR